MGEKIDDILWEVVFDEIDGLWLFCDWVLMDLFVVWVIVVDESWWMLNRNLFDVIIMCGDVILGIVIGC